MSKWLKQLRDDLGLVWTAVLVIGIVILCMVCAGNLARHLEQKAIARPHASIPVCHTPCKCRHLLNLGTWEWAECMGVGRK